MAFVHALVSMDGKEKCMAKFFMDGTKYAPFERMMMERRKPIRDYQPQKKKDYPYRKGFREKQRGK